VTEPDACRANVQLAAALPLLLHKPDQIAPWPSLVDNVIVDPVGKLAEAEFPLETWMPAGWDVTSPPLPFATTVRVELDGAQALPQVNVPPQPSEIVPQVFAWAAHVVGTHEGEAVTCSVALAVVLYFADIVALTEPDCRAVVEAVNVPTLLPDGMTMEAGTETKVLSLERATVAPPNGAGGLSVIVPVELPPPTTDVGFIATDDTEGVAVPH
jgi:hypothetical protein